jgi:hypothetical protein
MIHYLIAGFPAFRGASAVLLIFEKFRLGNSLDCGAGNSGLWLVVPGRLLMVGLLKVMFTMTCYIVLQFFKNLRIFDRQNVVSLVFSIVSLSQRGLGQAWDKLDAKEHLIRIFRAICSVSHARTGKFQRVGRWDSGTSGTRDAALGHLRL